MLEDEHFLEANIYLQPPEDGQASDEDSDLENGCNADHLSRPQLAAPAMFTINYGNQVKNSLQSDEESDSDSEAMEESRGERSGLRPEVAESQVNLRSSSIPERREYKWTKKELKSRQFSPKPQEQKFINSLSPTEIFNLFFDDGVIEFLVNMTTLYAQKVKGKHLFSTDPSEMRLFLAMLLLTGYVVLPRRRMYWEPSTDAFNEAMSECMTRNRFEELLSVFHLCDNDALNPLDPMTKIRLFYAMINERCLICFNNTEQLSIDEAMLPYYGRHSSKQRIVGKPVRMGYKMWVLATSGGYVVQFEPYVGAKRVGSKRSSAEKWGLGESVVLDLLEELPRNVSYHIFIDNFFTSFRLLDQLANNNIQATGVVRSNRLGSCTVESGKTLEKQKRGFFTQRTDQSNVLTVVGWNDNRAVYVASNAIGSRPVSQVLRYCRKSRSHISIDQPFLIRKYNKGMGGVDRCDQNVSAYRISTRIRKWWWALFVWVPDVIMQNSWLLYRGNKAEDSESLDLLSFRRNVVQTYLMRYKKPRPMNGRPRGRIQPASRRVSNDVRLDQTNHFQSPFLTQRRCALCRKNTRRGCLKCGIGLHNHCFEQWHGLS